MSTGNDMLQEFAAQKCKCGCPLSAHFPTNTFSPCTQCKRCSAFELANAEDEKPKENVNHPSHYGGKDNTYEAIKVIEAWDLGMHVGNAVKYLCRAGKKDPTKEIEDIRKAIWYLKRRIFVLTGHEEP
jgi:hypothetical protein